MDFLFRPFTNNATALIATVCLRGPPLWKHGGSVIMLRDACRWQDVSRWEDGGKCRVTLEERLPEAAKD